jgi:hypothetical protein
MRTTFRLSDDVLLEAKQVAARTGRTLTALVEDALRESLARHRRQQATPPSPLPVHGEGGLQPGVCLDDSAALWELTDSDDAPL